MHADEESLRVETYLREHIPLSAAMGVRVVRASPDQVRLAAPLAPNINHHDTVFGGSVSAVATLAAWTLLHLRLEQTRTRAQLVIQRGAIEYRKPIPGDFAAVCEFDDPPAWMRFSNTYVRRGRARLTLRTRLVCGEVDMASFEGDFVALRRG